MSRTAHKSSGFADESHSINSVGSDGSLDGQTTDSPSSGDSEKEKEYAVALRMAPDGQLKARLNEVCCCFIV